MYGLMLPVVSMAKTRSTFGLPAPPPGRPAHEVPSLWAVYVCPRSPCQLLFPAPKACGYVLRVEPTHALSGPGSTDFANAPGRRSKCRWGKLVQPLMPTVPMGVFSSTESPAFLVTV